MEVRWRGGLVFAVLACAACGDDGSNSGGASTSSDPTSTGGATSESTSSASTSSPTSTTASSTDPSETTASTGSSGDGGSSGDTTGAPVDCDALPAAPITPELVTDVFDGSDDIAFDGAGNMFGKQGDDIIMVDAQGASSTFVAMPGFVYDTRFDLDGNLLVARPMAGVVTRITPEGATSDIATGLEIANGLHVDSMGRVWISNPGDATILRVEANGDVVPQVITGAGATSVGGIVLDENRGLLFYSAYDYGQIRSAPIDGSGAAGEVAVVTMIGGGIHGVALDACGNLYAVGHGAQELYRLELDDAGELVGDPVVLAAFDTVVYNARFGSGSGFSERTLYAAGAPGSVWAVDVGVGSGL